ncbi:MAG: class 1 fructose-bisphosphatase [Halothiobacillaceae bacterium]|nr:MAG: class 1 fructose-bisphosphatase [Halothiobacillaceae bacterium]
MQLGTSLTHFLIENQRAHAGATGEFTLLMNDIVSACKVISSYVNKGDLIGVLGSAETENVQGETQKKLDIITNDVFTNTLMRGGQVAGLASEEMDEVYHLPAGARRGKYLCVYDPLDGSSNIDVNVSVGTIFSVLRAPEGVTDPAEKDFMLAGTEQVCAGYCIYGPSTMMVLTTGQGVNMFTLDQSIGEFMLTHENITVPADTAEFAINMSNQRFWDAPVQKYVADCIAGETGPLGKRYNMRWIASMVADVHRILTRGGIFLYPIDSKIKAQGGKLRLMYEANPMAMIVEQAGGMAITGTERILDIAPGKLHQRVPVILGSRNEVQKVLDYHKA